MAASLPSRERGLKCICGSTAYNSCYVAPLAGAWIEIRHCFFTASTAVSLPSRERGLKSKLSNVFNASLTVAPLAGAWIEIASYFDLSASQYVAPLAGAWIEICGTVWSFMHIVSRSPRGSVD